MSISFSVFVNKRPPLKLQWIDPCCCRKRTIVLLLFRKMSCVETAPQKVRGALVPLSCACADKKSQFCIVSAGEKASWKIARQFLWHFYLTTT